MEPEYAEKAFIKHPEHENIIFRHSDTLASRVRVALVANCAYEKNRMAPFSRPIVRNMEEQIHKKQIFTNSHNKSSSQCFFRLFQMGRKSDFENESC